MDNQEDNNPKQNSTKLPDLPLFQQANSDITQTNSHFTLPSSDSPISMLSSDEEESSEEEEEDSSQEEESNRNSYQYFDNNGFEDDFDEFLEDQESNDLEEEEDDFMEEEDEIDPDELSYEELLSLGEFIGVEKRGLCPNEISKCLSESTYDLCSNHKKEIDRCVICQMEYEEGESMVVLKPCDHPYHLDCITKWLQTKKICPICCTEPFITSRTD